MLHHKIYETYRNVESDDIVLLIIWNAMARGTQCMERIVEMFSPSHKKDAVPAAPQSRPLVKQAVCIYLSLCSFESRKIIQFENTDLRI